MIICLSFLFFEFAFHKIPNKLLKHDIIQVKAITSDDIKLEEMKQIQNIMEHIQILQENWEKFILHKRFKNNLNAIDVRAKCRHFGKDLSDLLAILHILHITDGISTPINVNER